MFADQQLVAKRCSGQFDVHYCDDVHVAVRRVVAEQFYTSSGIGMDQMAEVCLFFFFV